jgi:hypothetical protein
MQNPKLYACRPFSRAVCLGLALLTALAPPVAAAPSGLAAVEAVQWPAWVERGGAGRRPLQAGDTLAAQDRLLTGSGGRALLRLADGSGVKLGENAELGITALRRSDADVLKAALDVARGAFRFTTGLFAASLQRREVDVRVATITAGIRGTDLWGKSDGERDLVCLLEGRISVTHPQVPLAQKLDRPLSFVAAAKGQAPGAIVTADAAQVAAWSRETETEVGAGIARAGGMWTLGLATVASQEEALRLVDAASELGVPASVRPIGAADARRYRVRVTRLASRDEAAALAKRLTGPLGLQQPQIVRGR